MGSREAVDALLPEIYREMREIAGKLFNQRDWNSTLAPTVVVHEAYVRLAGSDGLDWESRSHFLALAARVMREVLIDYHRKRTARKRGGGWRRITLSLAARHLQRAEVDFLALEELLQVLQEIDDRQARVVELRFFGGLTTEEIATVLGISKTSVERDWRHARAWLASQLEGDA